MEWVEVTGRTVEEAKEAALDQLGVDHDDAEFEVLEEPKGGLFGRLRSEARVRARVVPTSPPPKLDRRDRRRNGRRARGPGRSGERGGSGAQKEAAPETRTPAKTPDTSDDGGNMASGVMEQGDVADGAAVAEEFLRGLLDAFGADYRLERRSLDDGTPEVAIEGDGLGFLIGPRGQTLVALQELTRTVVQRRLGERAGRIVIDIGGYRQARRQALERFAREVAEAVVASGVPRVLEPMPPPDRKVVHDTVATVPGATTTSEGEEPRRRVVIVPEEASGG